MKQGYLLDTNLLIGAFDPVPGNQQHQQARERLIQLLLEEESVFGITPLIRYEVTRSARRVSQEQLHTHLDGFTEFEIGREEAVKAAELSAKAQAAGLTSARRTFDFLHCAAALVNQLDISSQDGDMPKIMALASEGGQV